MLASSKKEPKLFSYFHKGRNRKKQEGHITPTATFDQLLTSYDSIFGSARDMLAALVEKDINHWNWHTGHSILHLLYKIELVRLKKGQNAARFFPLIESELPRPIIIRHPCFILTNQFVKQWYVISHFYFFYVPLGLPLLLHPLSTLLTFLPGSVPQRVKNMGGFLICTIIRDCQYLDKHRKFTNSLRILENSKEFPLNYRMLLCRLKYSIVYT